MHWTGSGALIFEIDAGLVGGRFCSLFFRFDISCALTLVPLIQNQCAGWQWVHWKPLVLRGRILLFGGLYQNMLLVPNAAGIPGGVWDRSPVSTWSSNVHWFFWGSSLVRPKMSIDFVLGSQHKSQCTLPRRLHWLFLRGPDPKSMHKIGLKTKKSKRICPDTVSVNAKSQCTLARRLHWNFSEVPKSPSIFFWSSKKSIDFFQIPKSPSILGWSSWHVHRFSGEVPDMCIDFGVKFVTCASIFRGSSQHVHRFSAEVPNMFAFMCGEASSL